MLQLKLSSLLINKLLTKVASAQKRIRTEFYTMFYTIYKCTHYNSTKCIDVSNVFPTNFNPVRALLFLSRPPPRIFFPSTAEDLD